LSAYFFFFSFRYKKLVTFFSCSKVCIDMYRIPTAALADKYHTTDVTKPSFWEFALSHQYKPVNIDYGRNVPVGSTIFRDPDCRYVEGWDPATGERSIGLKIWADDPENEIEFNTPNGMAKCVDITTSTTKFIPVNRQSFTGSYEIDPVSGWPLNPWGRTGIAGPGKLGRFGPNHACDPIVAYKKGAVCYFVAIKRKDTGEWAIPGGMIEPGESVTVTLKREFSEEAGAGGVGHELMACFDKAVTIYEGIVDDPRNTDNAWLETTAKLIDVTELMQTFPEKLQLKSGSDAEDVAWAEASRDIDGSSLVVKVRGEVVRLYASHAEFVSKMFNML
jgi:ADP-ribose pyrophosphatase